MNIRFVAPLRSLASLCVVLLLCYASFSSLKAQQVQSGDFVPGEVLVQYGTGASEARRAAVRSAHGAQKLAHLGELNVDHLRISPGADPRAVAEALRRDPDVIEAQPNYIRRIAPAAPPNDPLWLDGTLWGIDRIQAQAVWNNFGLGTTTVVVADIDTGVQYTHPDLAANMWQNPGEIPGNGLDDDGNGYVDDVYGIDAVNHDSDPWDDHGHGTHTAGTIGAVGDNAIGVVGVSRNVKILACKMISASGSGTDAEAATCFDYVVAMKNRGVNLRVTSNSWGSLRNGAISSVLQNAVDAAGNAGILNVMAAGNNGYNIEAIPFDPASFTSPSIIAVAAADQSDNRASFSNYGATSVDIAAPGVYIASTYLNGTYVFNTGTSMATPHVAGAAALVLAHAPGLAVGDLKAALMTNVDPLPQWGGVVASGGRLNAFRALSALNSGSKPTVTLTAPTTGAIYTAPATINVAAAASDVDGSVARVDFYANETLVGSDTTSPYQVTWSSVAAGSYSLTAVATDNWGLTTTSSTVSIQVNPASPTTGGAATFVRTDVTTQGNWRGGYGADGYVVVGDVTSLPSYASAQPSGHAAWTWDPAPASTRALQRAASGRVAATWYSATQFAIDVNLTDGQSHQLALYALDWDPLNRAERIDVVDAASGVVLDSRNVAGLSTGAYLVWTVRGHVRLNVVCTGAYNAVISGLFFDP